jgi:hypothetical protein
MRRVLFLPAEAPARLHLHDTYVVPRHAEQRRQRLVHVVRALQRSPHGDAVRRTGDGDHALRLDVELLLRASFVLAFDDLRGLREHGVDVAALHEERLEDVVVAPHHGPRLERLVDRVDGREWFNVDHDRSAGTLDERLVRVRDQHDRLFRMIDQGVRNRLVVENQRDAIGRRHVGGVTTVNSSQGTSPSNRTSRMRPRWTGLRTVAPNSMPGSVRSST